MRIKFLLLVCVMSPVIACSSNAATGGQTNPTTAVAPTQAPLPTTTLSSASAPATSAPSPTLAATVAPTTTSVPVSSATSTCDLPYYPVKPGAVRKYHWTSASMTTDETYTITGVTADGFTQHLAFSNLPGSIDQQWTCSKQGVMNPESSMPRTTVNAGGSTTEVRALKHTGVTLPGASQWQVGTSWSESIQLEETINIGGKPGPPIQATEDITSKIVSQDQVTVPAGTFTALRVDSTVVERLGTTNVSFPVSSWYAQGVGMVKQSSAAGGGASVTVELVSFTP